VALHLQDALRTDVIMTKTQVTPPKELAAKDFIVGENVEVRRSLFLSEHTHPAARQTLPAQPAITQANKNTCHRLPFPSILQRVLLCIQQSVFEVVFPACFKALDCTVCLQNIFHFRQQMLCLYSIDENTGIYNLFLGVKCRAIFAVF